MAAFLTGSIDANGEAITIPVDVSGSFSVDVSGTWSGTLKFQARTGASSTWRDLNIISPSDGYRIPSLTFNGTFTAIVAAFDEFRVVATAWTSGQADIALRGAPPVYDWRENHAIRILDAIVRSSSGTDSNTLRNLFYPNTMIGLTVTSVTSGPIAAPVIKVYSRIIATDYQVAQFTGVGTMTTNGQRRYMIGNPAWGGLWDGTAGFTLTRDSLIEVVWTLTGGQSVTYNLDIAQTL